jgi:hypothetical protein
VRLSVETILRLTPAVLGSTVFSDVHVEVCVPE